jgi:hypothetical protein
MPKTRKNSLGRNHGPNGKFLSANSNTRKAVGSRAEVMHGTADHTSGGLKKSELIYKKGRIISRKASNASKKKLKHLTNAGYIAKKGEFKLMKKQ